MGLLPLCDSCFAPPYPLLALHALSLSPLTSAYMTAPVSLDRGLPFSRTGIIGRTDGTWHER